ncbi:MAG: hypothetical protein R3D78_02530 [Paracoccaceae bacterium]
MEWLSMVLIVPFVLHIWKNWRPITIYLKRAPLWIALAVSTVAAAAFVLPGMGAAKVRPWRACGFCAVEHGDGGSVAEVAAVDAHRGAFLGATAQGYSVASPGSVA